MDPASENITVYSMKYATLTNFIQTQRSFSTKNAPGHRESSFHLHLLKFNGVKARYPSDYKFFLSSFVKFAFIIG